jgi:hypothetical protein
VRAELWRRFRALIEPLATAGRLGVVLLQYAPSFVYGPPSLRHIERCVEALAGYEVAVELRNKSWFNDKNRERTLAFERSLGVVNVVVDEPEDSSFSVPQVWAVTHPRLAVVRLHGRNADRRPACRARRIASTTSIPSASSRSWWCPLSGSRAPPQTSTCSSTTAAATTPSRTRRRSRASSPPTPPSTRSTRGEWARPRASVWRLTPARAV